MIHLILIRTFAADINRSNGLLVLGGLIKYASYFALYFFACSFHSRLATLASFFLAEREGRPRPLLEGCDDGLPFEAAAGSLAVNDNDDGGVIAGLLPS